ncbi:head GIN domain-containing protein [Bacteroidota bacterium]
MYRSLIITLFTIISLISYGQDRKPVEIGHFDEIRASGNVDVNLKKGDQVSAGYVSQGIDEDMIVIETKGNVLKASVKPGFHGDYNVKVYVTYQVLREIKASASARVYLRDNLDGDKINLKSTSGSLIDLEVAVNAVEANVDTGAEIKIRGEAGQLNVSSGTGAVFSGFKLNTDNAYLKTGTGGIIEVSVTDLIEASASTGGHIKYKGDPGKHIINETLGGSVTNE